MSRELTERLRNDFAHHVPSVEQINQYQMIRTNFLNLALLITDNAPASRELSTALTKLEEAMFWTNASIARNS